MAAPDGLRNHPVIAGPAVVLATVVLGALAGAAIWFATDAVSKTDIGGPGWSLRGNAGMADSHA